MNQNSDNQEHQDSVTTTETAASAKPAMGCLKSIAIALGISMIFFFIIRTIFFTPEKPYIPRFYYANHAGIIVTPVSLNVVKDNNQSLTTQDKDEFAVFRFDAPEGTQAGALAADIVALKLRKNGNSVLERDNIDRILNEQKIASSSTQLKDQQKIGKLLSVEYMIIGSVTFYDASPQTINIPLRLVDEDRVDYDNSYKKYKEWYINKWWPFFDTADVRVKKLRNDEKILSLEELEEEYKKYYVTQVKVVATVGISMKIVRVRDARIVWAGQAETNDTSLVDGTSRIVDAFIKNM